jgi:hypothetical protein
MQNARKWVEGLTPRERQWALKYLLKKGPQLPELNAKLQELPQPIEEAITSDELGVPRLIGLVAALQGAQGGVEEFYKMDNAWRKKSSRDRSSRVERIVILDNKADNALYRMMRRINIDRSEAVTRCIYTSENVRSRQWDDIKIQREKLRERESKLKDSRKRLTEKIRSIRQERDKAKAALEKMKNDN